MGDVRFEKALRRVKAARESAQWDLVSGQTAVEALGALAAGNDPLLANILATRVVNDLNRTARILGFMADGVLGLDVEGRVEFANPAACALLGRAQQDILHRDFHDLVKHSCRRGELIARDECPILGMLQNASPDRVFADDHDVFVRADGTSFFVGFTAATIRTAGEVTGLALVFRDITQLKSHEEQLELFRVAMEAVAEAVIWLDRHARIVYANRAALSLFDRDWDALEGASLFDFDEAFPPEAWAGFWRDVEGSEGVELKTKLRLPAGNLVSVNVRCAGVVHRRRHLCVAVIQPHEPVPGEVIDEAA